MTEWYGVTLSKEEWNVFRPELINRGLYFEPSGCYDKVHVEIKCTPEEAEELERLLY